MALIETTGGGRGSPEQRGELDEILISLRVMGRVLKALLLREARTRYGDSNIGYAWALIEPAILLIIMQFLFEFIGRDSPIAASIPVFILTGFMPFFLMRNAIARGASSVRGNIGLLQYPQVMAADVVIARIILEIATTTVVYSIITVALYYIRGEPIENWYGDPVEMLVVLVVITFFCLGSAFLSAGLGRVWTLWPTVWAFISRPLALFSGLFFTLETLPNSGRRLMVYNPFAHVIEWFRSAAIPTFESDEYSITMIMTTATLTLFIGLLIDRYLILGGDEEIVS